METDQCTPADRVKIVSSALNMSFEMQWLAGQLEWLVINGMIDAPRDKQVVGRAALMLRHLASE